MDSPPTANTNIQPLNNHVYQRKTLGKKVEPIFFNPTLKLAALRITLLASAGVLGCGAAFFPFNHPSQYVYVSLVSFVFVHHLISAFKLRFIVRLLDLILLFLEVLFLVLYHLTLLPNRLDPPSLIALFVAVWCLIAVLFFLLLCRVAAIIRAKGKNILKTFDLLEDAQRIKGIPIKNCPAAYSMLIGRSIWRVQFLGEGMAVRLIRGAIAGGLIIVLVAYGVLSFVVKPIHETALIPVKESRGLAIPVSEIKELEPQSWNFAFTRPLFAGMDATGLDKPDVFQRAVNVTPLWSDANNNQVCNRSEAVGEYERGAIFQTIFVTCPFRASQADLNGTFADVFEAELPDILIEVNYEELQIPANVLSGMWKGSVRVYVGFTNKTQYLTERATAIPLPANSHYLAEVLYDFRKVLKHPEECLRWDPQLDTDTFLSARIEHILPDPLASAQIDPPVYNMSSTSSTFRVYTSFDVSELRVIEDSRAQSVLGGFSAIGGLWTFIGGVFTMFFGTSLMRIFFGSKSLSIFGIAQQLEKDNIARGFLQEYPHIRQELNLPPSQRGIMTLLQDHMIDVSLFQDVIDSSETTKEKLMTSYDVEELGSTAVTPGTEVPGQILTYRQ